MRSSALKLPLLSFFLVTSCGPAEEEPGTDGHPCKAENHCVRQDGEIFCEDGYEWEDPSDERNYNCVPINGGGGGGGGGNVRPGRVDFALPDGGNAERGFHNVSGSGGPNGSHNWVLMDMNGDKKPDLVLFGQVAADGRDYGYGFLNNPHWRVYVNDGTKFVD